MAGRRTLREEIWNASTHFLGVVMCFLYFASGTLGTKIITSCMVLTYSLSVLYHSIQKKNIKDYFRMLDMVSIHISIASTSIAYCIHADSGFWGCILPILLGTFGSLYVLKFYGEDVLEETSVLLCIFVGIICLYNVICFSHGNESVIYFISGCSVYLVGLTFYVKDYKPYYHTIWHIFVLIASYIHIMGTI